MFDWLYFIYFELVDVWIKIIESVFEEGSDVCIKYEVLLVGFNNFYKNMLG